MMTRYVWHQTDWSVIHSNNSAAAMHLAIRRIAPFSRPIEHAFRKKLFCICDRRFHVMENSVKVIDPATPNCGHDSERT